MAVALVVFAVVSAVTQHSWAGKIPLLFESKDPSGHVMMQVTLGIAFAQSIKAAALYGNRRVAKVASSYAFITALANSVFLNHTAYSCHTVRELCEGFNWSIALVVGSKLVTTLFK